MSADEAPERVEHRSGVEPEDGWEAHDRRAAQKPPRYGALVRNIWTTHHNPHQYGRFVRTIRRTGRMNPGTWWQLTNGCDDFWEVQPRSLEVVDDDTRGKDSAAAEKRARMCVRNPAAYPSLSARHVALLLAALDEARAARPDQIATPDGEVSA